MTDASSEHGRRANAWRYSEGTMWGQDEFWYPGSGEGIPVEDLEPSHLANIIRKVERGAHADMAENTPLMRRLRELHEDK